MNTIAAEPKPVRRAVGAVVIPAAQYERWYALASATAGLNDTERGVLSCIAEHFRQLAERGYGMTLSHDRMARRLDVDPVHVRWAVNHLVELGLLAVQPGGGQRPNE